MTFAISRPQFTAADYRRIDSRFYDYMDHWKVIEQYKGETITIPGTWNAEIFPFNYYQVIKVSGDPNNNEEENEKELSLACGWRNQLGMFDREVQLNLRINGKDVLGDSDKVSAEIIKCGGANMQVYFKGKLITNFKDKIWWYTVDNGYQTISDMRIYL